MVKSEFWSLSRLFFSLLLVLPTISVSCDIGRS